MRPTEKEQWRPMATAPKDGTRIIVVIRASEQGASDVDVVRWAKPKSHSEYCWMATDSRPGLRDHLRRLGSRQLDAFARVVTPL